MKRKISLPLAAVLLLLLVGCAGEPQQPPAEETTPQPDQIQLAASERVFAWLPWGTTLSQAATEHFTGTVSVVEPDVPFAGLEFQAWYTFQPNGEGESTLTSGTLLRSHYLSTDPEHSRMDQAVEDFNKTLESLRWKYGTEETCLLRFYGDKESQPITPPLTLEQFSEAQVLECIAQWDDPDSGGKVRLSLSSYGTLTVDFVPKQQSG